MLYQLDNVVKQTDANVEWITTMFNLVPPNSRVPSTKWAWSVHKVTEPAQSCPQVRSARKCSNSPKHNTPSAMHAQESWRGQCVTYYMRMITHMALPVVWCCMKYSNWDVCDNCFIFSTGKIVKHSLIDLDSLLLANAAHLHQWIKFAILFSACCTCLQWQQCCSCWRETTG